MIADRDDAYLVQATLNGEQESFGELARRYRKAAFGVAYSRLGDYDAALDIAQEALVTAYVQLPVLRDPRRFGAWLYRITGNIAMMRLRRRHQSFSLDSPLLAELPALGPDPLETVQRSDESHAVREALTRLPETDRLAVVLHYVSGYSHEEIADMMDVSVSSVKTRIYRARRRFREEMLNTMETMGEQLPDVELTEDLLERILVKFDCGEHGVIVHLGGVPAALPGMPRYTERTKEAVLRIADRLRNEGCRWLYAPPHIPDGSPALPIFRSLGFQTEMEMYWYERDLAGRLPAVPPLDPAYEVRALADTAPGRILALLRATSQSHAPEAMDEEWVQRFLRDPHIVREASVATYRADELAAIVWAGGITSWENWKYEPGTGILVYTEWDVDTDPESVITHLISLSLRALKKAGLKRAVKEQMHTDYDHHQELIPILKNLGFKYIRSQWNLKLRLNADG